MSNRIRFTKMHGIGNDFVVIDGINQSVNLTPERIRRLSDRRFGVGCDQVLIVSVPEQPENDFRYRIFNCDGEEVENCGNGIRCFAKFVRDKKLTGKRDIRVETLGGILVAHVCLDGRITVDMGVPQLEPEKVPFTTLTQQLIYPLSVGGSDLEISAVSMGNPHAVTLVDDVKTAPVETLGPLVEAHENFPQRVNAGFMAIKKRDEIDLRVYERGAGETLACGTGACAAVVAGRIRDLLDEKVTVNLSGGQLSIEWSGEGASILMTGPAANVYQGQIRI